MKSIKFLSVCLVMSMILAGVVILIPEPVQASEKEYKELNPTHVANVSVAVNIACWGDNLAWGSGYGNITMGTSSGPGATVDTDYYSSYNDLAMSDNHVIWTNMDFDADPYTRSDIAYASPGSGTASLLGANTEYDDSKARLDGNKVLYEGYDDMGSELRVSTIGSSSHTNIPCYPNAWNYDISDDHVVGLGDYSKLLICDTSGNIEKDYGEGWYATENLRISGDYICYYDLMDFGNGANLYVKNWRTNETDTIIYHMDGQPGSMDIEGNFVTFFAKQSPEGTYDSGGAVFIYDIQAKTTYQVSEAYQYTGDYKSITDLAIGGDSIAWIVRQENILGGANAHWNNIYAAELPAPGDPPAEDPDDNVSDPGDDHIIGTAGGIISREGFNLDIPSGSLSGDTTFSVSERSVSSEGVLSAFDILPSGISFDPAAELTLDIPGTRATGNELMRLEDGQWVSVESTPAAGGGSLIAQITQTGSYAVTTVRDTVSQAIDSVGGTVSLPDVSLNIPADALASSVLVTVEETFVDAANVAQAVAVDLGGQILSVPAQLNFSIPAAVDGASAQVGQLVDNAWIEVDSTLNDAGQLVADITEGGIYALIEGSSGGLDNIIDIPFPSGLAVLSIFMASGLIMAIFRKRKSGK